jgi:hypothetical protein
MELEAVAKAEIRLTEEQRSQLAKQLGIGADQMDVVPTTVDLARYDAPDDEDEEVTGFALFGAQSFSSSFSLANTSIPNIREAANSPFAKIWIVAV